LAKNGFHEYIIQPSEEFSQWLINAFCEFCSLNLAEVYISLIMSKKFSAAIYIVLILSYYFYIILVLLLNYIIYLLRYITITVE
jgi:hypothetical protein